MGQQHTLVALRTLKLHGMADALERQFGNPQLQEGSFEDRLAMLLDAEKLARDTRRVTRLLKAAQLKYSQACAEDIDYRASRGLDKRQVSGLLGCEWMQHHQHVIITGPTGAGKTWIACAFAVQAVRQGVPALYYRLPRLLEEMEVARETGTLHEHRMRLSKIKVLVLDDWGVAPISAQGRQDLLEVIDDRTESGSLVITAQRPVAEWHAYLGDPTIAEAILDRVVHNSHRITLQGESMRKHRASKAKT